jgi:hypothetical protein
MVLAAGQGVTHVLLVLAAADGLGIALVLDGDGEDIDLVALAEKLGDVGGDTDEASAGQGLGRLIVAAVDVSVLADLVVVVLGVTTATVGHGNRDGGEGSDEESLEHFEGCVCGWGVEVLEC